MRGDYKDMLVSGKYSGERAKVAYIRVFDQYVQEFGLPREYSEYLQQMVWAAEEYAESIKPGERWRLTLAQAKENEAKMLLGEGSNTSFSVTCAQISRAIGFGINPKTVTVAEFYGYLQSIN